MYYSFVVCLNRSGGVPARNAKGERLLVFLGIIDILQNYRLEKKLEHTLKALIHDGVFYFPRLLFPLNKNYVFWEGGNKIF